jgi:SAM-dependent methyltransferase
MDEVLTTDHVLANRRGWNECSEEFVEPGRVAWGSTEPFWGVFSVPESRLGVLPDDVMALESVELGCGTGYVSAWLARRGASVVGLDNSPAQLATARLLQREFGPAFPLVHGDAERAPFRAGCFDLAISEYGASIWCDPYRWIPEAARLLRPGGRLIFLVNSSLLMLCVPEEEDAAAGDRLLRPSAGMCRFEWPDSEGVEFHLTHGETIRLLHESGFAVEDLIEVYVPADATTPYPFVTGEWASKWPCEEIWRARRL